ncbi:hypothetical protein ACLB2K_047956 [Fragaria x ananassa]
MASNPPPFQVEDTDEDFFDKLVGDDLDPPGKAVGNGLNEGSDSDEAKAFANLSIGDSAADSEVKGGADLDKGEAVADVVESSDLINGAAENNHDGLKSDSELVVSKGNDSGVKQVDWGKFNANSGQNGGNGSGSYSDFFNDLGDGTGDFPANVDGNLIGQHNVVSGSEVYRANSLTAQPDVTSGSADYTATGFCNSVYYSQPYQEVQASGEESKNNQPDVNSAEYWESLYPGYKLDVNTWQWYLVDDEASNNVMAVTDTKTEVSQQKTPQPASETVTQTSTTGLHSCFQGTNGYPAHMFFDPKYPDYYWDTVDGEWHSLEAYHSSLQTTTTTPAPGKETSWPAYNSYNQQVNIRQPEPSNGNQQLANPTACHGHGETNGIGKFQSFIPGGNFNQPFDQRNTLPNDQTQFPDVYHGSQKPVHCSQQPFQSDNQIPYAPTVGRSSAGRPPHALVTFGFGGKLIVMKDSSSLGNSSYGSQDPVAGSVSVLNLTEVFMQKPDSSSFGMATCDYFRALCQQSFPGPLVGGNVGSKELNKWIDERIAHCDSPDMEYRKGKVLRLLISLLKIGCQHYGKLRSPFGTDTLSKENDTPESAVAKLFASAKSNGAQLGEYNALSHCVQNIPSEGQIRATASEVQNLLVSGRKKDALQCAQAGQLWGPALVLASQLGEQLYVDTVKQMAVCQLIPGSPLRTLCLLIAGQPAEVFSADTTSEISVPGAVNMPQHPGQFGSNKMLDDWEENLAVITANRTKDDELVIIHLGDTLWKDRSEITAAHICYLIAEANFESYSDTARLCLIGADHWKLPRTYASPEAIQRTELYEYSKMLGNSQFILLPFQPYKLIYAHMLAEVGRVSDSLKYCQIILKSLKTVRAPEVETWKQLVLSLEDRIRAHQQGGYSVNFVSTFKGKLLNFIDSTAHRVVGLPPPAPSTSQRSIHGNEHYQQPMGPRVSSSQSTMAMSSLIPSPSMEPINDFGHRKPMHNRSVSEPDFGRTQVDPSKEINLPDGQQKTSGGTSRLTDLFQKAVFVFVGPRTGKQAKLGETNKFYYDEKRKRWVEEGAEPPAEEPALPPPPTTAAFQNGISDYNLRSALKKEGSLTKGGPELHTSTPPGPTSGTPPVPPSSNQFSARGRMGIRSRYVDTFNQSGGMPTNLFQSPSVPSVKPAVAANAKFFIPTPVLTGDQSMDAIVEHAQEVGATTKEDPSTSARNDFFHAPPPSSPSMQRYPSMGNIQNMGVVPNSNGPVPPHSRRTASWGGNSNDIFSPPKMGEIKPLGEALGMSPAFYRHNELPSQMHAPMNGSGFGEDLHEVEL